MENVGTSPAPMEAQQTQNTTNLPTQKAGVSSSTLWVVVVLVISLLVLIGYSMAQARRRREQKEAQLRENLASNTGGLGNGSVENVTKDVETPEMYAGVEADAKAINSAGCVAIVYCVPFFGTNVQTVFRILQGKTKRQLAGLNQTFERLYNRTLDNWIQSNMWASDIQKAFQIMLNAK